MAYFEIAERILIDMPIGSVVAIAATIGYGRRFFQHADTGIIQITAGAYCRVLAQ